MYLFHFRHLNGVFLYDNHNLIHVFTGLYQLWL